VHKIIYVKNAEKQQIMSKSKFLKTNIVTQNLEFALKESPSGLVPLHQEITLKDCAKKV